MLCPLSTGVLKKADMLIVSFVAMIFVGLGNKIFQKLETIPMYKYVDFVVTSVYDIWCLKWFMAS